MNLVSHYQYNVTLLGYQHNQYYPPSGTGAAQARWHLSFRELILDPVWKTIQIE